LKICGKMPLPRENAYNLLVRLQKANKLKTKAKYPVDAYLCKQLETSRP